MRYRPRARRLNDNAGAGQDKVCLDGPYIGHGVIPYINGALDDDLSDDERSLFANC
jgi:hypothetical protein